MDIIEDKGRVDGVSDYFQHEQELTVTLELREDGAWWSAS